MACFRLVNLPKFADFLIAVEAEMNKVSWPTRTELFRSSVVVIVTILVSGGDVDGFTMCFGRFLLERLGCDC